MKTKNSSNLYNNLPQEEQNHDVVQLSVQPIESNATTSGSKPDSPISRQELDDTVTHVEDQSGEAQSTIHSSPTELSGQSSAIIITSPPAPFPQKRKLYLRMALLSTGMLAILAGGVIGGLSIRKAQYDKMAQAQIFFNKACHTETFSNAQALKLAQQNWTEAENLLRTVPFMPGLGIRDAQEIGSMFDRCKQNLDATSYFFEAADMSRDARNTVNQLQGIPKESWIAHLQQLDAAIEHLKLIQTVPQDLLIFRASQQRLDEYQGFRVKVQNRLNQEQQAVENFQTAEKLHEQFAAKQAFFDTLSRSNAEQALVSAIDYLKKVPSERTTVSAIAIQTLERYNQELSDFRIEPVRQNLRSLADSFAQLSSDLQTNLTFDNNTLAALDHLANQFTQFQQETSINTHPSMPYFAVALQDYQFAQALWQDCNEQTPESNLCFRNWLGSDNLYLGDASKFHDRLIDRYRIRPLWMSRGIRQKDALRAVFKHAQQNVEQAKQWVER
ncbi:MAG: hypothetical protein HY785_28940 [Oscillatoriophycideae cyanobacterium NC_groundwater_1537_Pr4_S-0.65um_50_18]|nr:hypothetical protein [Oscillatoriophycideae cyanobacterium NC_groundwater_1537_Pr4_S-0.65um_50_18]